MNTGNDNRLDWTAGAAPKTEGVAPSLWRSQPKRTPPQTSNKVMDTLLGENRLSASDMDGGDPYNATGRFFRR